MKQHAELKAQLLARIELGKEAELDLAALERVEKLMADHEAVAGTIKNHHAVELGRNGGRKGGLARAKLLSKDQRSEIARMGAAKRWGKLTPYHQPTPADSAEAVPLEPHPDLEQLAAHPSQAVAASSGQGQAEGSNPRPESHTPAAGL